MPEEVGAILLLLVLNYDMKIFKNIVTKCRKIDCIQKHQFNYIFCQMVLYICKVCNSKNSIKV